jgi:hypothetical protein
MQLRVVPWPINKLIRRLIAFLRNLRILKTVARPLIIVLRVLFRVRLLIFSKIF